MANLKMTGIQASTHFSAEALNPKEVLETACLEPRM